MRLQRLTNYLLQHKWQAVILTFLITYIPVIGMLSIVIAAFVTLTVGVAEGALFTFAATIPYALVFITGLKKAAITTIVKATVVSTVCGNILTWIFAAMLRRGYSWSLLLQIAALFGVLVISVIHLLYPEIGDWWSGQLQAFYNESVKAGMSAGDVIPLGESQIDTINAIKYFASGVVTAFILFTALVQVLIARWWQAAIFSPGKLRIELRHIHLSKLAGILFIAALIFYYLENEVVLDILPILCLLFSAAGLSLIHYLCGRLEPTVGRLWLSIIYIALMYSLIIIALLPLFAVLNLMLPVVIAVMILALGILIFTTVGLLDVWMDVRKKQILKP